MEPQVSPVVDLSTDTVDKPVRNFRKLAFHGNAGEYFSIWIVNLLLSIVTLGIYSAWAQVRTNRYFYANTEAQGHRFRYLAQPMQILRGRIIAIVVFALFYIGNMLSPIVGIVGFIGLLVLSPWLVVQSLKFRMKMTSYRNIRFGFKGTYGGAFKVYVLYPILSLFTLYLALPFAIAAMTRYTYANITYGDREFSCELDGGNFWITSFISTILGIALIIPVFIALVLITGINDTSNPSEVLNGAAAIIFFAGYVLSIAIAGAYYTARIRNYVFYKTEIEGVAKFSSNVDTGSLVILRVTNVLALVFSLGLAFAWVQVRNARFFTERSEVLLTEEADNIFGIAEQDGSAFGDEASDVFDVDIAMV